MTFPWSEGRYVDDFGVFCNYADKRFDLTFDLEGSIVLTFSDGTIDLEPLLVAIETNIKKNLDNL